MEAEAELVRPGGADETGERVRGLVRVLGPVELRAGATAGETVDAAAEPRTVAVPLPPDERSLLAALALAAAGHGRGHRPGAGPAAGTLSAVRLGEALSISAERLGPLADRLRASLAAAGLAGALVSTGRGYALRLPVDAEAFRREVLAARRANGDTAAGLARALRRWRGTAPAQDCALHGWAAAAVGGLAELRLTAVEDRWAAALRVAAAAVRAAGAPLADPAALAAEAAAVGTARAAVDALAPEADAHPLRERVCELLMIAYGVAGRGRLALARYEATERAFLDQLGVGPGERLRAVAAAVRAGELGDLAARAAAPEPPAGPPAGPSAGPSAGPDAGRPYPPEPPRAALPVPLTPLIGRETLLAGVVDRVARHRLVTLTGPGGAGKTRLAVAAAARVAGAAAWFVEVSTVESPVRVPAAVAAALDVRDEPGRDIVAGLCARLGEGPRLLVLDGCERLVAGCAELVARLLERCAGLRVLATSRAPLGVAGEAALPVPPLAVPTPRSAYTLAELAEVPAARLFLDRVAGRAAGPVPESAAGAVAQLCVELDGLPLALELAAARLPLLSVAELVGRLRSGVGVLRSPDPTVPARHRTLVAAVESSIAPLEPRARALLRRLAVFAGTFDADGAAAAHPAGRRLLPVLVDASLVERVDVTDPAYHGRTGRGPARYRMLAPIRRCAEALLAEAGEETAARRAHAAHHLALVERAEPLLSGPEQESCAARLAAAWADVRAAVAWLGEAGAAGVPHGDLRLAAAAAAYCHLRGHYRDGRGWLASALARHPDAPAALRARAATGAAMLAMLLCDYGDAARYATDAAGACAAAGDARGAARVELIRGSIARERARYADAAAHCDRAAARFADLGDEAGETRAVQLRGFVAWLAGDPAGAEPRLRVSLRRFTQLGDAEAGAAALVHLGAVAHYLGEPDRAAALLDAALERYAGLGFPEGVAWAHDLRGRVDLHGGRLDRAAAHLAHSLAGHRAVGDRWRTASVVEALAEVARQAGAPRRAAALLAHAAGIRAAIGAPVPACERPGVGATEAAARAVLGTGYEAAAGAGRAAALEELLGPDELPAAPALAPAG